MTDINELTAKLKAAAIYEQLHTFMAVKPGDILALTEALEAAQCRIIELSQKYEIDPRTHEIIDLKEVIAEQDQRLLDYAAIATKNAEKVADLEARKLTVTCPDVMPPEAAPAHYWGEGESMAYADGYNKSSSDLKASIALACASAGIKFQIEGE